MAGILSDRHSASEVPAPFILKLKPRSKIPKKDSFAPYATFEQCRRGVVGVLIALGLNMPSFAADWPGWRGPLRDGHAALGSIVPESLPAEPRRVWQMKIGEGLASPVVAGDQAFFLDAQDDMEVIHALDKNRTRVMEGAN
ncbi:MAG: hypothetical protein EXS25_10250 [Pedosphaera sp.]|nr:hypothetical protein [Pedosphaera sp.]